MLAERRILLGGLIALAALTIIAVLFLYLPNVARRSHNLAQVKQLNLDIQDMKQKAASVDDLRRKVVESEKEVTEFSARVASYDSLYPLVSELMNDAQQGYRLEVVEVRPPAKDTLLMTNISAPLVPIPYQITVRGRYLDIGQFLESLDRFRYFVRVPEIEVVGRDEIRPFVEARLLLNIYATKMTGAKS
jgi:Tfp pilus assembly protein PilO